ncbi:hypothetical protein FXN63_22410 [Pigmentiphaga aceris]|uniref:Uncharacterized protein n=1 Tax=Pigmentiphaga aceris TaxID=1940612 RepID=A0A5C0B6L8_9BURK|nr:hypothetical protein [Pigmentiphaga aceris]QEI08277.1 hypothetical protein FXN63_22410 [Pigmentiphaga aceris]
MTISIGAGQVKQAVSTNFQDAPLGRIGNLAFVGKPGATPRAPSPNLLQRIGAKIDAIITYIKASPQQRAAQQVVSNARKLSADTGALLGAFTGVQGDAGAHGKAASALAGLLQHAAPLAQAGRSTTSTVIAPALTRHLDQLKPVDLDALRAGPLANEHSRQLVLDKLDPAQRPAAAAVMDQIATAVEKQTAIQATARPVAAIGALFTAAAKAGGAIDVQAMDAALEQLSASAGLLKRDGQTLHHVFAPSMERMSDADLSTLSKGLSHKTPGAGGQTPYDALLAASDARGPDAVHAGARQEALDGLQAAVAQEITKRLDHAVIAASTPLQVKLMDRSADVRPDAIVQLGYALGDKAGALGASELAAFSGRDVVTALTARALTDLPDALLDRLLGGADAQSLARAQAGIAGLPEPRQTALRAAVEMAHENRIGTLTAQVDQVHGELETAVTKGDRGAITLKLQELAGAVDQLRLFGTAMGHPIADTTQAALRDIVSRALAPLRADSNSTGPLSEASLAGLTKHEFGNLRQARGELGAYGLGFDRPGVTAQLAARTLDSTTRAEQAATQLLHTLADPRTSAADVVRQVRQLSSETAATLTTLTTLGEEIGADDIGRVAASVVGNALTAFRAEAGEGAAAQLATILERYDEHIGPLSEALPMMRNAAASLVREEGDPDSDAIRQTLGVLGTGSFLMQALRQDIEAASPQADRVPYEFGIRDVALSPEMQSAVAGEFGLRLDAGVETADATLSVTQRAALDSLLTETPTSKLPVILTVPVNGVPTDFSVSRSFELDAFQRHGVSFTVSGRGPDGQLVQASSLRPGIPAQDRPAAMGESLHALQQVAGEALTPLTEYMHQQLSAGLLMGLVGMETDSPIRLPSGETFEPGGQGTMNFDIERLPEGRLMATVTVAYNNLSSGFTLGADGERSGVMLDPGKSRVEAQFSINISDDGRVFEMRDPLHLRYTLTPTP